MEWAILERHRKGDLTEAIVMAELKERNIPVSRPFGDNERYDLLVETPNGDLLRIQIKTGQYLNGTIHFRGVSNHTNSSGSVSETYAGDVDYFVVYSHRFDTLYLVDASEVNTSMDLRVEDSKINHPAINWARDFEFDRCWPPETHSDAETATPGDELPAHRRGDATEARVIAELLHRGVSFSIPPTDNERFDLILASPADNFYRIQVKTGWIQRGCVTFRAASSHVNSTGVVHKRYEGDIDYFLVFEPTREEMYLISEDEVHSAIYLRVDESKQTDRTANHAKDYLFDRNWPPEGRSGDEADDRPKPKEIDQSAVTAFSELDTTVAILEGDDSPYDLLAETPEGGLVRCAFRQAQTRDGRIFFNPDENQEEQQFDQYLLYGNDQDQFYLIDQAVFDSSITLWIEEPEQRRRTTLRARDYELERQWPPTGSSSVRKSMLLRYGVDSFHAHGVEVAYPTKDTPFDIWVESDDDRFIKVAIEPGWVSDGCIRLKPDSKLGIDCFLIVCRDLETCYLVRVDEFDVSISLRIDPPKRDDGTVRFAEEYELSSRCPIDLAED